MEEEVRGRSRIDPSTLDKRQRYHLMTSLVVPRPIGWVSSRSRSGVPNLAPFSYYNAVAATPMLIGVSIGHRRELPKDTLLNIRETGAFCVNVVTEHQLEQMNQTSGEHSPDVDEFEIAGLPLAESRVVSAPYVANCPAVLECRMTQEVELTGAEATLVIAEVVGILLADELLMEAGTMRVTPESLLAVGRMGGDLYCTTGEIRAIPRPVLT